MKLINIILTILFAAIIAGYSCRNLSSENSDNKGDSELIRFYTGSYASEDEAGITLVEFSSISLEFSKIQEVSGQINPSFLELDQTGKYLYAVNETSGIGERNAGSVSAFAVDQETGKLKFINMESSLGPHPCHLSVTENGKYVAVANYSGGSIALLPTGDDGSLLPATGFVEHEGSGPDPRRQRRPHAHSITPVPATNWLLAADLGTDNIIRYRIGDNGELLTDMNGGTVAMAPGAGPRHVALNPDRKSFYVINELNSTITMVGFDPDTGTFNPGLSVSTLPSDFDGENFCADIHVHPSGKFLYGSNRGHNSIAVFDISSNGTPRITGHENVRGEWPRNFGIDPSGRFLFVANQNSNNITVFRIDQNTGLLSYTGAYLELNRPVCIRFAGS